MKTLPERPLAREVSLLSTYYRTNGAEDWVGTEFQQLLKAIVAVANGSLRDGVA